MRGLLVKDMQLALTNGRLMVIVIFIGIMTFFLGSHVTNFFVGYVTLIFSFQVCTTITYDTIEHGEGFLMTLPITRKMYVAEKYLFGLLCAAVGWCLAFTGENIFMLTGLTDISWAEVWAGSLAILAFGLFLVAVCIPVQFKFGGDNGKIVVMAVAVVGMVVGFLVVKLVDALGIDIDKALEYALVTNRYFSFAVIAALLVIIYVISFLCSLRIINHKEF